MPREDEQMPEALKKTVGEAVDDLERIDEQRFRGFVESCQKIVPGMIEQLKQLEADRHA